MLYRVGELLLSERLPDGGQRVLCRRETLASVGLSPLQLDIYLLAEGLFLGLLLFLDRSVLVQLAVVLLTVLPLRLQLLVDKVIHLPLVRLGCLAWSVLLCLHSILLGLFR